MKKFFLFLVLVAAAYAGARYEGWVTWPAGAFGTQTVQRAGGPRALRQQKVDEPPVLTAALRRADVPVTLDAVGTIQALNNVAIVPQVDGRLIDLKFTDGQFVNKGDVIALIDPSTYQAAYDQAVAKKAQDMALLANAKVDLDRYQKLAAANAGSKQQADTQVALVAQYEAMTRVDQALIDSAKTTLDYTVIKAPISGRTGIRGVDPGNIVHSASSTASPIVTIAQVQPIAAIFNLPQQQLRAINAGQAKAPLVVQALADDNKTVIDTGKVITIDNQVDTTTGTVRVKAQFPNPGNVLWPGQFANMRVFVDTLKDAVVAPTAAIQRGPDGAFVYVVGDDRKAVMTPVTIARQDEQQAVIASGAAPPARVVTTGFALISDGTIVAPTNAEDQPVASAPPPSRAGARRQGGGGAGAQPANGAAAQRNGGGGGANRRRDQQQPAGAPSPPAGGGPQAGAAAATQ
jgi:membrane fusion protein, multidrug efflux system